MIIINPYQFGAAGYDADALAYFAQLSPAPSTTFKDAVNQFIVTCKADGNWSKLDRFWLFAAGSQQHARVSIVNPTSTQITEVNSPTWTSYSGYNGNAATSYLNLQFNAATQGVNYQKNDAAFFYYTRSSASQLTLAMGAWDMATTSAHLVFPNASGQMYGYVNSDAATFPITYTGTDKGLVVNNRSNATQQSAYLNGSLFGSVYSSNSTNIPSLNAYGLGANQNGSLVYPDNRVYSIMGYSSGSLSQLAFYNAVQTLATSLGFNV